MGPQTVYLPDGQTFTVSPIFGGKGFKSNDVRSHGPAVPVGWTVVLNTEEMVQPASAPTDGGGDHDHGDGDEEEAKPKRRIKPFVKPSLEGDKLFISSISRPSGEDYIAPVSPTREVAMMIWVTLYWYFHQEEPPTVLETEASRLTPAIGRPRGEWRIGIKRDGLLRRRNLIPKLERMGLIASMDTAVGVSNSDGGEGWQDMFVTRRMFWQIPARLFLTSLRSNGKLLSSMPGSPAGSRPGSPTTGGRAVDNSTHVHSRQSQSQPPHHRPLSDMSGSSSLTPSHGAGAGALTPFYSTSHLPTYFPPAPLMYTFTDGVRHPHRQKPPHMGEVLYTRYIPSVGQFLSFRVASTSNTPVPHPGPVSHRTPENTHLCTMSDTSLLQMWMGNPRVEAFWGEYTPNLLTDALSSRHSFPVIGMWDGVPFGYFEIYWVKEDILGRTLGGGDAAGDFDRGLHILIGEEWARGRVPLWLGGLVHWCLTADLRTMNICLEPRIDNKKFLERLEQNGFNKVKQVSFPHKQSWYVKMSRESWEGPAL